MRSRDFKRVKIALQLLLNAVKEQLPHIKIITNTGEIVNKEIWVTLFSRQNEFVNPSFILYRVQFVTELANIYAHALP